MAHRRSNAWPFSRQNLLSTKAWGELDCYCPLVIPIRQGIILRKDSETRRHILFTVEKLLAERRDSDVRIADIALEANVAVQTVYYHFNSLRRVIAEAQASAYLRRIEPLHRFLGVMENAILDRDGPLFWKALGDDVELSWSFGFGDDSWRTSVLLFDVWADPDTRDTMSKMLDAQFDRWVRVIESAKSIGWVKPDLDTFALIAACWAGSNGQGVFSNTRTVNYTPETMRDFWLEIAMTKH